MAALDRLHGGDGGPDRLLLEPVAAGVADPLARDAAKAEAARAVPAGHLEPAILEGQLLLVPRLEEQLAIVHGQQAVGGQRAKPIRIEAGRARTRANRRLDRVMVEPGPDCLIGDGRMRQAGVGTGEAAPAEPRHPRDTLSRESRGWPSLSSAPAYIRRVEPRASAATKRAAVVRAIRHREDMPAHAFQSANASCSRSLAGRSLPLRDRAWATAAALADRAAGPGDPDHGAGPQLP